MKMDWVNIINTATIQIHGSNDQEFAKQKLLQTLREYEQMRALRSPLLITEDEMSQAWYDTHNRDGQEPTREALNAILATRLPPCGSEP